MPGLLLWDEQRGKGRLMGILRSFMGAMVLFLGLGCGAQGQTVTFKELERPVVSTERGWWRFAGDNFRNVQLDELKDIRAEGITLVYGVVRLDPFRETETLGSVPADLERSFGYARQAGVKVILRFVYNYPQSSQEYDDAEDATLEIVEAHIDRLAPVIAANADTIAVWQAGFIGAWGEGHTSSNGLDSDANKAKVRDMILAAAPAGMHLQWRYPSDLLAWEAKDKRGRFGMHNDCFLSSPTDVGSYSENPAQRQKQRAAIAKISGSTYFSGETCDAEKSQIRKGCSDILQEGAQFHVQALGIDYYTAFHKAWKSGGCYEDVSARMGYRFVLVKAVVDGDRLRLTIRNEGWARMMSPRKVKLKLGSDTATFGPDGLESIAPGEVLRLSAKLPGGPLPRNLCISAPDPSARLAGKPAFAVRFANADQKGQVWKDGAFCFALR
jgi:hypothetical protein